MLYSITYKTGPINSLTVRSEWGRQHYEVIINGKRFIDRDGCSGYKSIQGAKLSMNNYLKAQYVEYGGYGRYRQGGLMTEDEYKTMMKELMGTTPDKMIYIRKIDD